MGSGLSIDVCGDKCLTHMGFYLKILLRGRAGRESADHGWVAPQALAEFPHTHLAPFAGKIHQHSAGRHQGPLSARREEGAWRVVCKSILRPDPIAIA